jgi:hypothetical protein
MFRKLNLLFAITFVSGGIFAQETTSILTVLNNQGLTLDVVSTSQDQSTFAGISKETSSLIVAQKKNGNYKLPEKIDASLTEGAFRPEGFSENEYLFFSVYDASSFIIENKYYVLRPTNVRRENYITNSNYANLVMNSFERNPNRAIATFGYYRPQRFSPYHRSNQQRSIRRVGIDIKKIDKTVYLFTESNAIVMFTDNFSAFIRFNLDGTIASENEIELKNPLFWSNKGRGVVKDEVTNEYYIFTETNFSYNWYSLNSKTGATKFITKMNDVWENPNFRIDNGQLHYQKMKAEKLENYTLDLKN